MQHARRGRKGTHDSKYHLYLILEEVYLKNSVAFAYGNEMERKQGNKREVLLDDVEPIYGSEEKMVPMIMFLGI